MSETPKRTSKKPTKRERLAGFFANYWLAILLRYVLRINSQLRFANKFAITGANEFATTGANEFATTGANEFATTGANSFATTNNSDFASICLDTHPKLLGRRGIIRFDSAYKTRRSLATTVCRQ